MRSGATRLQQEVEVRCYKGVLSFECSLEVLARHSIVLLCIIHTLLDLEDLYREDGHLSLTKSLNRSREELTYDHTSLSRGIRAVVNGAKDDLITPSGVHRIQIMNEALHRLVGIPSGAIVGTT